MTQPKRIITIKIKEPEDEAGIFDCLNYTAEREKISLAELFERSLNDGLFSHGWHRLWFDVEMTITQEEAQENN